MFGMKQLFLISLGNEHYLSISGESQLTHGHGSEHARIDRSMRYRFTDDSKTKTYHLARAFCLVLLLNGQAGIHRRLRRTWGDGVISQPEWYALVQSLLEIWQQQTLLVG